MRAAGLFCLLCCTVLYVCEAGAFVELGGDLPKLVSADKSPYLAISDLYIPAGKTVQIEAGTVIMFKNFTSIHVRGTMVANGTALRPIVFTSENDQKYNSETALNPTPYDWNGVYIHKEGFGTSLENVNIMYSVKGLFSETKYIRIADCIFRANGRSNCVIEGNELSVDTAKPLSHDVSIRDAKLDGVPIKILKDPDAKKRNVFRYSGLGLCVAGVACGGIFGYQWYKSNKDYHDLADAPGNSLVLKDSKNADIIQEKIEDKNRSGILSGSGGVIAAVGCVLFVWSFTF